MTLTLTLAILAGLEVGIQNAIVASFVIVFQATKAKLRLQIIVKYILNKLTYAFKSVNSPQQNGFLWFI